jgi:ribonuclease/clavin/mitogillin
VRRDRIIKSSLVKPGVKQFRVSSRWSRSIGFWVSFYLVGDILIDTGFPRASKLIDKALAKEKISAILCTHHHEDHAGNCSILVEKHKCPVYLSIPLEQWGEGVKPMDFFRKLWWGMPENYQVEEMPEKLVTGGRTLIPIPIPGHSVTHTAFFEEETGLVFAGDLYVSSGASATMPHENPYQIVDSLRRVAALKPKTLLGGHGMILENPASKLNEKADRMESVAAKVVALNKSGLSEEEIVKRLFKRGRRKDYIMKLASQGGFSRLNFVKASLLC